LTATERKAKQAEEERRLMARRAREDHVRTMRRLRTESQIIMTTLQDARNHADTDDTSTPSGMWVKQCRNSVHAQHSVTVGLLCYKVNEREATFYITRKQCISYILQPFPRQGRSHERAGRVMLVWRTDGRTDIIIENVALRGQKCVRHGDRLTGTRVTQTLRFRRKFTLIQTLADGRLLDRTFCT